MWVVMYSIWGSVNVITRFELSFCPGERTAPTDGEPRDGVKMVEQRLRPTKG